MTPTSEIPPFQQVPIFEYDSIDNNIDEEAYVEQNNEQSIVQDNNNLAIVPVNVLNTLTYHQLQGATQSQFIISLSPEIVQLLDSNISQQLSILYNTTNTHNSSTVIFTLLQLFSLHTYIQII